MAEIRQSQPVEVGRLVVEIPYCFQGISEKINSRSVSANDLEISRPELRCAYGNLHPQGPQIHHMAPLQGHFSGAL